MGGFTLLCCSLVPYDGVYSRCGLSIRSIIIDPLHYNSQVICCANLLYTISASDIVVLGTRADPSV